MVKFNELVELLSEGNQPVRQALAGIGSVLYSFLPGYNQDKEDVPKVIERSLNDTKRIAERYGSNVLEAYATFLRALKVLPIRGKVKSNKKGSGLPVPEGVCGSPRLDYVVSEFEVYIKERGHIPDFAELDRIVSYSHFNPGTQGELNGDRVLGGAKRRHNDNPNSGSRWPRA